MKMYHWFSNVKVKNWCLAIPVAAFILTVHSGCRRSPAEASTPPQRDLRRISGTLAAKPSVQPPHCPPYGATVALTPPQASGHRVILSWKKSAPADSKHAEAFGYCIYRGTGSQSTPTELLNPIPFRGTTCMDDSVQNDTIYSYAVRAISARNYVSDPSAPTHAKIPKTPRINAEGPGNSIPLCWQPDTVK